MAIHIPSLDESEAYINEAQRLNPGPWLQHSRVAAGAAQAIAGQHPGLDPQAAYIMGIMHDIGRREGVTDMRHALDGYRFLMEKGYPDAARVCISHSFPVKDLNSAAGKWDCTADEMDFLRDYLSTVVFDEYDRLIQLCDAIALPTGFCLVEKRLVDVALRRGVNEYSIPRWQAFLDLQQHFENVIGQSIYKVLPGVVENTFGFVPCL